MSTHCFTKEQTKTLSKHPHVTSVSPKAITYTEEFKKLFLEEYRGGKKGRKIFEEQGLDPNVIGHHRIKHYFRRWSEFEGREEGFIDKRRTRTTFSHMESPMDKRA